MKLEFLKKLNLFQICLLSLLSSLALAEIFISSVEFLFFGSLSWRYLLTELLASLLIASLMIRFFWKLLVQNEHSIALHQHVLNSIAQCVLITDADRNIISVNETFEQLTGYSQADLLGKNCSILQGLRTDPEMVGQMRQALGLGQAFHGEILNYRKCGRPFWNELSITPVRDSDGRLTHFAGVQRDVSERKQYQRQESIRNHVLGLLAKETPLDNILNELVSSIEAMHPNVLCTILLVDAGANRLRMGAAPSLPEAYNHAIDGMSIGEGQGSCGTAACTGQRVIVSDIAADPLWADYREVALLHGLKACWSAPVMSASGQVLAAIAIYYREIRTPDEMELEDVENICEILGVALESIRNRELLKIAASVFDSHEGIIVTDASSHILQVNHSFTRIYGYEQDEMLGATPSLLQSCQHDQAFYDALWEKLLSESHWAGEVWDKRKNGEIFPAWVTISAVVSAQGQITHYVGTFSDITEQKRIAEELRTSQQLVEAIVENIPAMVFVKRASDLSINLFNRAGEELLGYSREEMLGKSYYDFWPEEQGDWFTAADRKALASHEVTAIAEESIQTARGETRYLQTWMIALRDANDEPTHLLCISIDITERKRNLAELHLHRTQLQRMVEEQTHELRTSEAETKRLLVQLDQQKYALDQHSIVAITDVRGRIESVNYKFCEISGYSRDELLGQDHIRLNSAHHPHGFFKQMYRSVANGITWHGEICNRAKDGSLYWVDTTIVPMLGDNGKPERYIAIRTDITESKRVEDNLVAATRVAEQANQAKDSFLATMSHEIRTPLTGMLGMLEVLSLSKLDTSQQDTLRAAWDSSRSLLRIVNDILDWSKIEAGHMQLEPQATSIPDLLQEVTNTYSRVASGKSLMLWHHSDVRLAHAYLVDSLRLSQILNNFVSNAIKFTHHGEVELRAELLEHSTGGGRIKLSVKDTGVGISEEAQQHLFKHYQQGSADTARMYGGTGLGLAISQRLSKLMNGTIEFLSEPGLGTTFSLILTLPVTDADTVSVAGSLHSDVYQGEVQPLFDNADDAPWVLAVDDHPINRELLANQIRLLGLRVETAENGHIALSLWREGRFAVVITDCHMPEMDGYTLVREMRRIEAGQALAHTPVIAWTANALAEEEHLCKIAGMDELLIKPTGMTNLKKMLAKCLHLVETDAARHSAVTPVAYTGQKTMAIDFVELSKIVPDITTQIRLLNDFEAHMSADRIKLLGLLAQGDRTNVERTAHRMKGSSRMVGAMQLASVCAIIEQNAKVGDMIATQAALKGLDTAFSELENHLLELNSRKL